jgi:hypothetical protein
MISALVGIFVAGIAALVAITVLLAVVGVVFGLAFGIVGLMIALVFKVLPILLVGWVVVKLIQRSERPRGRLSASDRAWLDT